MCPQISLPVSQEQFESAGSKFISLAPGKTEGFFDIECDVIDWKTPGVSLMLPVTITEEGINNGKADNFYMGVSPEAVFKTKETLTVLGIPVTFVKGKPNFDSEKSGGKKAVGHWVQEEVDSIKNPGTKIKMVKLQDIYPAGYKPTVAELQ